MTRIFIMCAVLKTSPLFPLRLHPLCPQYARGQRVKGTPNRPCLAEQASWVSTLNPFLAFCRMGPLLVSKRLP